MVYGFVYFLLACIMISLLVLIGDKTGTARDAHNRQAYLKYDDQHIYQLSALTGLGGRKVCPPNGSYKMIELPDADAYTLLATLSIQGDDFILRSIQGHIRTYDFQNGWLWLSPESTPELFLNDDTSLTIYNPNGTPAAALQFCRGVPERLNHQEVKL